MSAAGTSIDTGTVLAGRWVLTQRIGTGASSHVYAAREPRLDRWVAVKVMHPSLASDPTFLEQFRNEATAVSALDADNVVRFFDAGNHDLDGLQIPYIVTALMAGGSLRGMLDAGRRLDVSQAVAMARGAAKGLNAAHEAGIVHRDVKPSNLLFDTNGGVALSDFGISRAIAAATSTEPIGSASATTRYASPEQMQGRAVGERSDMYSLALVVIESVTGMVPLLADTIAGTVALRAEGSIDVSVDFGALRDPLLAATEADPQRRCTAADFSAALAVAAERVGSPRPLELAVVEGLDEQTSELRVGTDAAGLVVLGPMAAGAVAGDDPQTGDAANTGALGETPGSAGSGGARDPGEVGETPDEDRVDLRSQSGDARSEEFDREVAWSADSIALADEHARLAESVPAKLGQVEPLDVADAPGAVADRGGPQRSKKPRSASKGMRTWMSVLLALALLAAAAFSGWWFAIRVPTHEVPSLVGGDLAAATATAEENSWQTEVVERTRVDGTTADEVVAEDPPEGTELAEGETLALTISDGPTLTAVPPLAGMPEPEATAAIESAGLVLGARGSDYNEDVPAGVVLQFAPAEGIEADAEDQVPRGTAIDILVSEGPAPRQVPAGLVGSARVDAEAALDAVQLAAEVSSDYSDTVAEGVVISAGIEPGTEVPRGTAVPLVVSDGPRPIVVPDVVGQSGSGAAATLEGAGFTVSGIEGSPTGTVLATDPVAGESRTPGAAVRIFTRS